MTNKKFLFISVLSIVQSTFAMDVAPEPELVRLDDGHEWTQIRRDPAALVPFFELRVAWRSDDIPDKGMKLEEHPNHGFGVVMTHFDSLILHRSWPHLSVDLSQVPLIAMRLLTCKEARSWLQSPLIGQMHLKMTTENLIPSERIKYFRGHAFEKCCPEKSTSERNREAVCLLVLKKRKGNLVAQCPKEIVRLIADQTFDMWVHKLQAKKDPEMLPGAQLVFQNMK